MNSTTIRQARIAKGLTQETLAERVGITQGYLSRLENGSQPNVTLAVLERIANELDLLIVAVPNRPLTEAETAIVTGDEA